MRKITVLGIFAMVFLLYLSSSCATAQLGVRAGDWVRCDLVPNNALPSEFIQWVKMECLSVAGTTVTLRVTTHLNNGAEQVEIMTWDIASGAGNATFQALIPANSNSGDTIKVVGGGDLVIAGETTGTYAGASRTVVYASLTQGDMQFNYRWDKQTGVLVEVTLTQGSMSATFKAAETNLWQPSTSAPLALPNLPIEYISIGVSVIAAIAIVTSALVYTKHKRS
ncbi:MAG: hypothetical protein QXV21_05860 [Candidatus Bathyarchaeia archaeon]